MFKVYKESCKNCLLSPDAIVSSQRRKQIINECHVEQRHFVCHKASMNDEDVCCNIYYNKLGHTNQMIRIAERLGAVEFIEQPDSEKLPSHKEMNHNL